MAQGEARDHYKSIASSYDSMQCQFYDSRADIICKWLNLLPSDTVADIGAGTGAISSLVWNKAGLHHPILAVDPSPHMLEIAKGRQGLDTMEATFDQFIESGIVRNYHKFVCIGCVHHFPQLPLALKRFCSLLNDGDQLLIIEEPEPALWDTARKAARKMSVDELEGYLKMAGFSDVKRREDMQSRVYKRDEYFDCLHNRCYSVLSIFTDEEIERGLTELNETVFEGAEYKELPDIKTGLLATK